MLEVSTRRWAREAVAVFLALFFGFGCVAPLAAEALNASFHADACDRKGKCCCHRDARGTTRGIAISDASCGCESGDALAFSGSVAINGGRALWSAWAPVAFHPGFEREPSLSTDSSFSLLQRPPPSVRFA